MKPQVKDKAIKSNNGPRIIITNSPEKNNNWPSDFKKVSAIPPRPINTSPTVTKINPLGALPALTARIGIINITRPAIEWTVAIEAICETLGISGINLVRIIASNPTTANIL